jgi:outer membrane receptor protein involved in Fe transport
LLAHRSLLGAYLQTRWTPLTTVSVVAGLRYNLTDQHQQAFDGTTHSDQSDRQMRPSGSIGASWRLWNDPSADLDDVLVHAGFSNTFQLPQVDFGPMAGFAPLLKPESQTSFTAGIKADGLDGRFDADLAAFYTDFHNQPLNGSVNGLPALVAAGYTRYRGIELESSLLAAPSLRLAASLSLDDARYVNFNDANQGQLAGNRIEFTPRWRGAFGVTCAPPHGLQVAANLNAEAARYLDAANQHRVGAYGTVDAMVGYRWNRLQLRLKGSNLGDRREPVVPSELGDGQLYLLLRRHIDLSAAWALQ